MFNQYGNIIQRRQLMNAVEQLMLELLKDLIKIKKVNNFYTLDEEIANKSRLINGFLKFRHLRDRNRFTLMINLLASAYNLLLNGLTCTTREFYYNNTELSGSQQRVVSILNYLCKTLKTHPWHLGIFPATKGLIAGPLTFFMNNHSIIDCRSNSGPTLLPQNFLDINHLQTTAKFVLVVEKYTVFEKLLAAKIFENIGTEMILITGKGFPDVNTRMMVNKLGSQLGLPVYILVDADPFGIEIMFVYRYGSKAMIDNAQNLACPQARWIGLHPSELMTLGIPTVPLAVREKRKLELLVKRPYITSNIQKEIEILQRQNFKAEIENVSNINIDFLLKDYILNKINRNLSI